VEKQKEQAEEVVVVYEAEPLGYVLYRALKAREMSCYGCAPDSGEQKRKRRKKPHRNPDLTSNLFNYLNGNTLRFVGTPFGNVRPVPPNQAFLWPGRRKIRR
jgi:hypothetical protein